MNFQHCDTLHWGLWPGHEQNLTVTGKVLREGRDFKAQSDAPPDSQGMSLQPVLGLERWLLQIALGDWQMVGQGGGQLCAGDWMRMPWWRVELWREMCRGQDAG